MGEMVGIGLLFAALIILPIMILVRLGTQQHQLRELRRRIEALERSRPEAEPQTQTWLAPALDAPSESPMTGARPAASASTPPPLPPFAPSGAARAAPALAPPPAPAPAFPPPRPSAPRLDAARLEQLVGGVWLQNAGSILVLCGVFFLILWGYTTGRIGPEMLVGAGVLLGAAFVWRGDRLSRSVAGLGYALIGVGFGIVYLALYLGHFTLGALPTPFAFAALTLTSALALLAGLRYRVQTIAMLGVIGAFVPLLLAGWIPMHGFKLSTGVLLAYLAAVDALVFVLAARAGWSLLDLTALLLTAITWSAAFPHGEWTWWVTIGVAALFTVLGLAPLPRFTRLAHSIAPLDLAVIASAPLLMLVSQWPMLAEANPRSVAMLEVSLAALYFGAAAWVDGRRPERDLWRPLVGAATLFLSAALERAVGSDNTSVAWSVEGIVLVALGLGPRGAWLRACGYVLVALGTMRVLNQFATPGWHAGMLPVLYPAGLRDLACAIGLYAGAAMLWRARPRLTPTERFVSEIWAGAATLILFAWMARESGHVASAFYSSRGRWWHEPGLAAAMHGERESTTLAALAGLLWLALGQTLLVAGTRARSAVLRIYAYITSGLGFTATAVALLIPDGWSSDQPLVLDAAGMLTLAAVAALVAAALRLHGTRELRHRGERFAGELWAGGAMLLLLIWSQRQSDHVARTIAGIPGVHGHVIGEIAPAVLAHVQTLGAVITSGAWTLEALALLVLGWRRRSAFLRWSGLALLGVTLIKFLAFDLATVDVFWRFLIAVAVGAAMLAVSYAYQRRAKDAHAA